MTRLFFISLVFLILANSNEIFAQKAKHHSKWQPEEFNMDTQSDDWLLNIVYDSKSKFMYGISNDTENLYVRAKIADEALQIKVLKAGFILRIDTNAKKKGNIGIMHPLKGKPQRGQLDLDKDKNDSRNKNSRKKVTLIDDPMMILIGFGTNEAIDKKNNKFGIEISMAQDKSNNLYYTAIIPFKSIYGNTNSENNLSKLISIGLESGSLENMKGQRPGGTASNESSGRSQGGGRQGGGHGGSAGGSGGNGNSQQQAMQQSLSTPSELWIKKIGFAKN